MRRLFFVFLPAVFVFCGNLFSTGTPAWTVINNGGDSGTAGLIDTRGDAVLFYDAGPSTGIRANIIVSTVTQVFGLGSVAAPSDLTGNSNGALYYLYSATNTGNYNDYIAVSTVFVQGSYWEASFVEDTDQNGLHSPGENTVITGLAVPKDSWKRFFLKISIPVSAAHYSTATVKALFSANNGSGLAPGDGWGDIDLREDTVSAVCIDSLNPTVITDLSATAAEQGGQIDLAWTAPGDDPTIGAVAAYIIKYSTTEALDSGNWDSGRQYFKTVTPKNAGLAETVSLTGLTPGLTYWFSVKSYDEVPLWSGISLGTVQAVPISKANLSLVKEADITGPAPGDIITYTFTYSNSGTTEANNVFIKDMLPLNCAFEPDSFSSGFGIRVDTDTAISGDWLNKSNANDGDTGDYNFTVSSGISVNVGRVEPGITGKLQFKVKVN